LVPHMKGTKDRENKCRRAKRKKRERWSEKKRGVRVKCLEMVWQGPLENDLMKPDDETHQKYFLLCEKSPDGE